MFLRLIDCRVENLGENRQPLEGARKTLLPGLQSAFARSIFRSRVFTSIFGVNAMNENVTPTWPAGSVDNWEQLFEAALLEAVALEQPLQDAKDAIMDREPIASCGI